MVIERPSAVPSLAAPECLHNSETHHWPCQTRYCSLDKLMRSTDSFRSRPSRAATLRLAVRVFNSFFFSPGCNSRGEWSGIRNGSLRGPLQCS